MNGTIALHGGAEYVAGDEPAMDALLGEGRRAAGPGAVIRVAILPVAVARHRPDLAVAHGRAAFEAAGRRAGVMVAVAAVPVLDREAAASAAAAATLRAAHVIHLPGGDPDLPPVVLRETAAWAAILRALDGGACLAGASAGAMAMAERLWTRDGPVEGLGLVSGVAVLPHYDAGRAAGWRAAVDPAGTLAWLGLEERTLVLGRPGGEWTVHGAGRAHLIPPGATGPARSAAAGERLLLR